MVCAPRGQAQVRDGRVFSPAPNAGQENEVRLSSRAPSREASESERTLRRSHGTSSPMNVAFPRPAAVGTVLALIAFAVPLGGCPSETETCSDYSPPASFDGRNPKVSFSK